MKQNKQEQIKEKIEGIVRLALMRSRNARNTPHATDIENSLIEQIEQLLTQTRQEAIAEFGEFVVSAGLVDETDFRYEMKEYLEEESLSSKEEK